MADTEEATDEGVSHGGNVLRGFAGRKKNQRFAQPRSVTLDTGEPRESLRARMSNEAPVAETALVGSGDAASEPAAPTAPATAAAPAQSSEASQAIDPTESINSITDLGKLQAILRESKNPERKKPEAAEKPGTAGGDKSRQQPLATTIAPALEDDDAPEPGEPGYDATRPVPKHLHVNTQGNEKAAAFLKAYRAALKANPNANPAEIAAAVGYTPPAAGPAAPAAATPAEPARPDPFKSQRDRIEAIGEEMKKAATVDYDNLKLVELAEERADLKATIRDGEQQLKVFSAKMSESLAKAHALCPAANEEGTVQYALIQAEVRTLERTNPELLDTNPEYPLIVLREAQKKYPDHFPKAAIPAAPAAPVTQPGKRQAAPAPVRPVGAVTPGNQPGGVPLRGEAAEAAIDKLNYDDLKKLGDFIGTKPAQKRVW